MTLHSSTKSSRPALHRTVQGIARARAGGGAGKLKLKYMMQKQRIKQHIREYTVFLEPAEEGGYIAHVPALPGCATQGETVEEVLTMAKDAIQGYLAVMKEIVGVVPQEVPGALIAKVPIAA